MRCSRAAPLANCVPASLHAAAASLAAAAVAATGLSTMTCFPARHAATAHTALSAVGKPIASQRAIAKGLKKAKDDDAWPPLIENVTYIVTSMSSLSSASKFKDFARLAALANRYSSSPLILMGDLNAVDIAHTLPMHPHIFPTPLSALGTEMSALMCFKTIRKFPRRM